MDDGLAINLDDGHDDRHEGDPTEERQVHRRTLSNSILSRLNFLRPNGEARPLSDEHGYDPADDTTRAQRQRIPSDASAAAPVRTGRRRTGSLRKTAILGTGRIKAEVRERRNSLLQRQAAVEPTAAPAQEELHIISPRTSEEADPSESDTSQTTEGRFSYDKDSESAVDDGPSAWSTMPARPTSDAPATQQHHQQEQAQAHLGPASTVQSPHSASAASTTDEDDGLSFSRPMANGHTTSAADASSSSSSYFPPADSVVVRRRSTKKPLSPLSASPMDAYAPPELDHSYSETEWWGWVMLFVTWIVFVVGMGSCLGVWSWAWDVGQTPYAPPELEDDPTLPIVGYYPALIILTAVMAWVWVVVAWVGMKYFKHAKIQGDEG